MAMAQNHTDHIEYNNTQTSDSQLDISEQFGSQKALSITITGPDDELVDRPGTPSASRDISETDENWSDREALEQNANYRPSIVTTPLTHEDENLSVTIDRYGFPAEEPETRAQMRIRIRREEQRVEKWRNMLFPNRRGNMHELSGTEANQRQVEQWNRVKHHRKIKPRVRKGIPQSLRGVLWCNLCGARERAIQNPTHYTDLVYSERETPHREQLWKDIWRTYRKHAQFGVVEGQNTLQDMERNPTTAQLSLYNVLKAYSLHNETVGYCQGMSGVVALMLMHMGEEESFWVLAQLCEDDRYGMQNIWHPLMPLIPLRFYQMERLVQIRLPNLFAHFEENMMTNPSMYQGSQWFITIFLATKMSFDLLLRVWDIYLNEGFKTVFRVGLGILTTFEKQLLTMDFEEMMGLLANGPATLQADDFLRTCFSIKLTRAQLQALEHHYFQNQRNS